MSLVDYRLGGGGPGGLWPLEAETEGSEFAQPSQQETAGARRGLLRALERGPFPLQLFSPLHVFLVRLSLLCAIFSFSLLSILDFMS